MDNMVSEVGTNFWFVFFAYISAFLPWTVLASRDFIGPTWQTIKNTRVAGQYNVVLSVIPACYIVSYIVIQGLSNDYTEMCAALVALVFSLLHLLRTLWGLWQLRCFQRWAHKSIDALQAMGVPYNLTSDGLEPTATTAEVVERLLVNESVVDNQIIHGQVRCYITYANLKLQGGSSGDSPPSNCFKSVCQGARIAYHFLCDQASALFGRKTSHRIEQVPFEPVNVWLNWSVPFVAQGLGTWVKEFSVPSDPSDEMMSNSDMSAKERLDRRAEYFALQLLSSAWLQLWPELGLSSIQDTTTPLHWDIWDENSKLAKGLISKRELLKRAMSSGEALPFGTAHDYWLKENQESQDGYAAFRRMLEQVVNDLPVLREFDAHVEGFDIEKLEWLTILLYLGNLALGMQIGQKAGDDESSDKSLNHDTSEQGCATNDASYESGVANTSRPCLKKASSLSATDVVPSQALENLREQLNVARYGDSSDSDSSSTLFQCLSITVRGRSSDWVNNENRHVMKVGEMIDAWMSLLGGDQIIFMNEMNASDLWDKLCCYEVEQTSEKEIAAEYSTERRKAVKTLHAEVEKRRLCYDFANSMTICEHLEPYVTFMGYSMENVRSRLAMWVRDRKDPVPPDSFRPVIETVGSVTVDLDRDLSNTLIADGAEVALQRRGVQTRLLWELQRGLARKENKGPGCVGNIALCILSFPSLCVEAEEVGMEDAECHWVVSSVLVRFSCGFRICAMGGPQRFELRGTLSTTGKTVSATMSVISAQDERIFEWELWRDAFLGRLMGLKDWQERRGIRSLEFRETLGRMDQGVVEVHVSTGEEVMRWAGWEPFRFGFLRFELESEGLLQQNSVQTVTQKLDRTRHKLINGVRTLSVEYAAASPEVLRQAYLLVKEAFMLNDGATSTNRYDELSALMTKAQKCLTETNNMERAVFLFQTAATIGGNFEALERCIEILIRDVTNREAAAKVVDVLEHFIAKLVGDSKGRRLRFDLSEAAILRAAYEKVIERFGDLTPIRRSLPGVLESILCIDPDGFMDSVLSGLQIMYCMSKDEKILSVQALLISAHVSDSFNAKVQLSLDIMYKSSGQSSIRSEIRRDLMRYCKRLCRKTYSKTKEQLDWGTVRSVANVLKKGDDGKQGNAKESAALYRRAINEWNCVPSMICLARLLGNGVKGVPANAKEAVALYRRAIDEGNDVTAMCNLAILLENGAEGVPANSKQAVALYRRAIDEWNHVTAMNNLAVLLENGAEGVPANAKQAVALYRRAIDEGNYVDAMSSLAALLENGAEGVPANAKQAVALYRRAIDEGNDVDAMYNLAILLENGAEGVQANAEQAVALYQRAIDEGNDVDAMNNLAVLLRNGAEGVPANAKQAVALYRRAIDEGNDLTAMYNLAALLENGADGVAVNVEEAELLYRRVFDVENSVPPMSD